MESDSPKTPETIVYLTVACQSTPEESLQELNGLVSQFKGKIKLLKLIIAAEDTREKLLYEGPNDAEFEKIQQVVQRTKQIIDKHHPPPRRGKLRKPIQNKIPYLEEDLFLKALEVCDRTEVLFLLKYNAGVTVNVLRSAMEMISGIENPWGGNRQYITKAILTHPKVTEEIIWLAIKSPNRTVRSVAVPQANLEMLDCLENPQDGIPISSSLREAIGRKRRHLENLTTTKT
ncbi:hypothetical protein ACFL10_00165 [Patescibacteria group bacterium]